MFLSLLQKFSYSVCQLDQGEGVWMGGDLYLSVAGKTLKAHCERFSRSSGEKTYCESLFSDVQLNLTSFSYQL